MTLRPWWIRQVFHAKGALGMGMGAKDAEPRGPEVADRASYVVPLSSFFAASVVALAGASFVFTLVVALLAALATTLSMLVLHARHQARRRRREEEQARAARRESAVRILWAASGDFLSAGWGRNDLERLRLLTLNLDEGQVLGPRIADRLRNSVSSVLSGVLDRLGDVVITAREVELEPHAVGRLEAAIRVLVAELEDVGCRAGEAIGFRPRAVALAASQAVDACAALREALRPHMVSDLGAIVDWIATNRFAGRVSAGELIVDLAALGDGLRVAARPLDLSHAIDELLQRVFARGQACGPVRLSVRSTAGEVTLAVSWTVREQARLDARPFTESLRVLSSYGARLALKDVQDDDVVRLEAVLPAVAWPGETAPLLPEVGVS